MSKSAFQQLPTSVSSAGAIGFVYVSNTASITIPATGGVPVYYDSGITISITPQFSDSHILLMGTVSVASVSQEVGIRFYRSGPDNIGPVSVGAASSSFAASSLKITAGVTDYGQTIPLTARDLADTTEQITYSLQVTRMAAQIKINNNTAAPDIKGITQIIALEISEQ